MATHVSLFISHLAAPPKIDAHIKDQKLEAGEPWKLKLPLGGDGPFEVKVKKDNKEVPLDRLKISVFDDFATIALKGRISCFFCLLHLGREFLTSSVYSTLNVNT